MVYTGPDKQRRQENLKTSDLGVGRMYTDEKGATFSFSLPLD